MTNEQGHGRAHTISQLLGEVIIHHAPWTAEINERVKRKVTDQWLDGLEEHTASFVGPFLQQVLDNSDPPDAVKALFAEMIQPTQAFSAILEQIFLFGIASTVIGTSITPFLQVVTNALWPVVAATGDGPPLSPADLATLNTRGIEWSNTSISTVLGTNAEEAAKSGLSAQQFQALCDMIGSPPSPQDLFEMFRRGIIAEDGVVTGLREGDTRDEWIANFIKLAYTTPTPIDMVRAAVQNQLTYSDANTLAISLGLEPPGYVNGNPDWFQLLFDIAGRPPGPQEWGRAANRGIVPWTGSGADAISFEQAIAESDVKTKYTDALQALAAYFPAVEETRMLYQSGSITLEQAQTYWTGEGVPADLIAALSHQATIQEVQQERALAKGNVLTLLYDGVLSETDATNLLGVLGFSGQTATYLIELTSFRRAIRATDMAARKIGTLYLNYKITATDAKTALSGLGIPDDQAANLLEIWQIERTPEVRLPSVGELGKAVQYGGLPFATAVSKAQLLGYTAYDATLIIAGSSEQPPPNGYPADSDTGVDV